MTTHNKRHSNRKYHNRIIGEELARHDEFKEELKSTLENYQYMSQKERTKIDAKFCKPKNESQARYFRALEKTHNKIIIATGPAGTGKTLIGTEFGIRQFLSGKYEKLIFTRPAVSADEDLGFLPGTLEDKMAPWIRPIYDILYKFITPAEVTAMVNEKLIEIAPLAYMRGRTLDNAFIILDEAQNTTDLQIKMFLTRIGSSAKAVITGDLTQIDLPKNQASGLIKASRILRNIEGIGFLQLDDSDVVRHKLVKQIIRAYDKAKELEDEQEAKLDAKRAAQRNEPPKP